MINYGKELILDLHECNPELFTRKKIRVYFKTLCKLIDMEACKRHWWDELYTPEKEKYTEPHLIGTSAIQFIKTSNITIHTLDILKRVYLNIFSCKDFDAKIAENYSAEYFEGRIISSTIIDRI